jgi:hypothetical protein
MKLEEIPYAQTVSERVFNSSGILLAAISFLSFRETIFERSEATVLSFLWLSTTSDGLKSNRTQDK